MSSSTLQLQHLGVSNGKLAFINKLVRKFSNDLTSKSYSCTSISDENWGSKLPWIKLKKKEENLTDELA